MAGIRSSEADIGFLNRLWLVPGQVDRFIAVPEVVPDDALNRLVAKVGMAIRMLAPGGNLTTRAVFAPDARPEWTAWYTNFRQRAAGDTAARIDAYGLRLCVLLAACEHVLDSGSLIITANTVKAVEAMLDWQLRVREQFFPTIADNQTAAMEQKLAKVFARAPGQWIRRKDVYALVNGARAGTAVFDKGLEGLLRNNAIEHRAEKHKYSKNEVRWYRSVVATAADA